jgi:hypothetical protein
MSDDFHVVRDSEGEWRVKGPDAALSKDQHESKAEAIATANASASQSGLAKVVVHNDDGTIDYLEHGHGVPAESADDYRTPSGSDLKAVDAKVSEALNRGVEAIIKQRLKRLNSDDKPKKS